MMNADARSLRARVFLEFTRSPERVTKILVVRRGLLGDTVFITPVLARLKHTFPQATVDAVVSKRSSDVLAHLVHIRHVLPLDEGASLVREFLFYLGLRREKYDIAVVLETNSHHVLMAKLLGAKFLVGFENKLGRLLDYQVPWRTDIHFVENQIGPVRVWTAVKGRDRLHLNVVNSEEDAAWISLGREGITHSDTLVVIHPGTSNASWMRVWSEARYAELADSLVHSDRVKVVFTGSQQDVEVIERIRRYMQHSSVNLAGKTSIRELIALLSVSSLAVGPDTGALHLACAVRTPVAMLMGFSDPGDTGPYDDTGRSKVARVPLQCSPCVERVPKPEQWKECESRRSAYCMESLTVEQVLRTAHDVLIAGRHAFVQRKDR